MLRGACQFFAVALYSLTCAGCTKSDAQQVGEHRFVVPQQYLIPASARPFFLPKSTDEGFTFVLNPGATLPQQILVVVDSRANTCRRAAGSEAYVKTTVCADAPLRWRDRELLRSGNEIFWNYVIPATDPTSRDAILITCSEVSTSAKGLCTADLPFGDLVLTLYINDLQVPRLAVYYDAATAFLRAWERSP